MFFVNDERAAARSADSNSVLHRFVDLVFAQETKPRAFSAKSKAPALPALCDLSLDGFRLSHMALAAGVRSGQHASQEQLHIKWLSHVRPPM